MSDSNSLSQKLAQRFKTTIDSFRGDSTHKLVNTAKRRAGTVSLDSAKQAYDEGVLLLDVREVEEWRDGHVENAMHIPRGMLEFQAPQEERLRDKDTAVITYCAAGARSALAAERLEQMGWQKVKTLNAGYEDWAAAGYPVAYGGYDES